MAGVKFIDMAYNDYKGRVALEEANAAQWGAVREKTARQNIIIDRYGESVWALGASVQMRDCTTMYQIYKLVRTYYVMAPGNACYGNGEYLWASTSMESCKDFLKALPHDSIDFVTE